MFVKIELVDYSEVFIFNFFIILRGESELRFVFSIVSSIIDYDILLDSVSIFLENVLFVFVDIECILSILNSSLLGKNLNNSFIECFVEINVVVGSGRNILSLCFLILGIYFLVRNYLLVFMLMLFLLIIY